MKKPIHKRNNSRETAGKASRPLSDEYLDHITISTAVAGDDLPRIDDCLPQDVLDEVEHRGHYFCDEN